MRFAFVITNLAGGGAEKALIKLVVGLRSRGHAASLWLLEDQRVHQVPADVPVHAVAERCSHGWFGKRIAARRLRRALAADGPFDLIVSTLPFADEVATLAALPHHWCRIANTLGAEIDKLASSSPAKARRRVARYRQFYGHRPLIAVSEGVAADLRNRLGLRSRIEVIPNAFDFEAIRHAAKVDFSVPRPYVVHVGRFSAQKRHDLLLDAWLQVDTDRELVLLTPPDRRLEAMIAERGLAGRVRIAGFQSNPYPWIAHADLLVLCSDHEGLPNVLIEALACGTPAVSTDCPSGPREILKAFPECLVPCNDAWALSTAIKRALVSPPNVARADLSAYEMAAVVAAYERLAAEDA